MPQFVNEYEGFGNALMGLGAQYSARSEREKEEKRRKQEMLEAEARRKAEKMDDRAYAEERSNLEYERNAPLEKLKLEAARLKAAREEAEMTRPRVSGVGSTAFITTPNMVDGVPSGWNVETREATPRTQPRSNAARTVETNGRVMQFNDSTGTYDRDLGAARSGSSSAKGKDPLDQGMALMGKAATLLTAAQGMGEGNPEGEALKQQAAEMNAAGKALMQEGMRRMKEGPAPKQSTSSGVWDALGAGFKAATQYGRSEEAALTAAGEGKVPPQVAADTAASILGAPTAIAGDMANNTRGTPNATGSRAPKIPPADDYAASFAQVKQARPNWTDSMITDYLARKGITKKG